MATRPLTLEGVNIKAPSTFTIQKYNVTKSGRVASGMMTMELVAKKRKFITHYNTINSADKTELESVLDGSNMFMNFTYEEDGVIKTAKVYVGDLEAAVARNSTGTVYYKDWEFHLIEQ